MNKTAAVFGTIWGIFGLFFCMFLFLILFAPAEVQGTGFEVFGASLKAYYSDGAFAMEAWIIAIGAFGLSALGLIGAGLVRQHHITAGLFLLISNVGMLVVAFQAFLMGENGVFRNFVAFLEEGQPETVLTLLITLLITLLGFFASLFSLAAKPRLSRPQHAAAPQPAPPAGEPVKAPEPAPPAAEPVKVPEPAPPVAEPVVAQAQPEAEPVAAQAQPEAEPVKPVE
jgi:hypothetical protein